MNAPTEYTPRSLSALSAYLTTHVRAYNSNFNNSKDNALSISYFYIDASRKRRLRHRNHHTEKSQSSPKHKTPNLCGPVSVFTVSKLLPISRPLAEQYLLTSKDDIIGICEMNAKIANNAGRRDLFQTWCLVRLSAEIYLKNLHNTDQFLTPWSEHPFGRRMIQSMIEHYALKCNDIQMAAMIACAFSPSNIKSESFYKNTPIYAFEDSISSKISAGIVTVTSSATPDSYGDWSLINSKEIKRTRSNSWSEYGESADYANVVKAVDITSSNSRNSAAKYDKSDRESILDSDLILQYDYYKKIYADILYRWKLIEKRALLLRTIQSKILSEDKHNFVPFASECCSDGCKMSNKLCRNQVCGHCKKISLTCVMCRLPVRGAANHCIKCGHGGHTIHMQDWFQTHNQCPTGCGCDCMQS